jgi:hypothetical protein
VIGIAGDVDELAVLDGVEKGACVGAIVRACAPHDAITSVYGHCGLLCTERDDAQLSGTGIRLSVRRAEPIPLATANLSARADD